MPLLSRLFGRKRRDDEQTPMADQSLVFRPLPIAQPTEAQPPEAQAPDSDPLTAPLSTGLPGEPDEDTRVDTAEPAATFGTAEKEPSQPLESTGGEPAGDAPPEREPLRAPVEAEAALPQAPDAADTVSDGRLDIVEPFAAPAKEPTEPFAAHSTERADALGTSTSAPVDPLHDSSALPSNAFAKLVAEPAVAQPELDETADPPAEPAEKPMHLPLTGWKHLDRVQQAPARDNGRAAPFAVPATNAEPKTLIGGKEDDLVPLIPNTETDEADVAGTAEPDETGSAEAAVDSLKEACDVLVAQVKKLCVQQDGARIVAGMIALVGELDARYARDMGITRRNGVEELLQDVRGSMAEGDRFVLESLENGRGGLTADVFLHDLKTIALSDRPRLLGHYITFLTFMIKRVLHQYLRPLEEDETHTYEISHHLDYLIEGVQDILVAKVAAPVS